MARLFTDAYLLRSNVGGYGLWNVSRSLARRLDSYRSYLAAGDAPREWDLDGRCSLSDRALTEFCKFFFHVCLDQVQYMNGQLALGGLVSRLQGYVQLREKGNVSGTRGVAAQLRPEVAAVLCAAAVEGEITRGEVARFIGISERTGRDVLRGLLEEGLLISPSERGPVRLGFPSHAAAYLFPDLYPAGGHGRRTEAVNRVMREDVEALRKPAE